MPAPAPGLIEGPLSVLVSVHIEPQTSMERISRIKGFSVHPKGSHRGLPQILTSLINPVTGIFQSSTRGRFPPISLGSGES